MATVRSTILPESDVSLKGSSQGSAEPEPLFVVLADTRVQGTLESGTALDRPYTLDMPSASAKPMPPPRDAHLPTLDRFKPRGDGPRPSRMTRWRAVSLVTIHVAFVAHLVHWQWAGETLTPLEPSEAMETLEVGTINAGFLLFVAAIFSTILVGRFFCGWACHVVAYQDLAAWLLARIGLKPRPVRSRVLALVPFGLALYMFVWPTVRRLSVGDPSPEFELGLTRSGFWDTFPGPVMAIATLVVVGFLMIWWLGAKGFCTYGCPYGAFFSLADRASPTKILVTDACETCGHCTAACTSNVRVHEEVARFGQVVDPGCMKCMDCVSVCPKDALFVGFASPKPFRTRASRTRGDFSWPEEVVLATVGAGAVFAFRGLWVFETIPLLLTVGLSCLTALGAVTLWRALRRREFAVQHHAIRSEGRWTRAGVVLAAVVVGWLILGAHAGALQWSRWCGDNARVLAASLGRGTTERQRAFSTALAHLDRADSLALLRDPRIAQSRGWVLRELGQFEDAERSLRDALTIIPDWPAAAIPLSDLLALRKAWPEAEALLRAVETHHGEIPAVTQRLRRLAGR